MDCDSFYLFVCHWIKSRSTPFNKRWIATPYYFRHDHITSVGVLPSIRDGLRLQEGFDLLYPSLCRSTPFNKRWIATLIPCECLLDRLCRSTPFNKRWIATGIVFPSEECHSVGVLPSIRDGLRPRSHQQRCHRGIVGVLPSIRDGLRRNLQ